MSAYIPVALQKEVRERFSNLCAYCRSAEALTVVVFEFDHIFPLSAGGQTIFANLCLACPSCNRYKGTLTQALDPATEAFTSLFHPHRDSWEDHFLWTEGGALLVGLSPTGRATIDKFHLNRPQLVRVRRLWVALGEHPPA